MCVFGYMHECNHNEKKTTWIWKTERKKRLCQDLEENKGGDTIISKNLKMIWVKKNANTDRGKYDVREPVGK